MNDISLNIEHLVLESHTIQPENGEHLARMTEAALRELLEQHGLPPGMAGGDVAEVITPNTNLPLNASDQQTAQEIALALYWTLDRLR